MGLRNASKADIQPDYLYESSITLQPRGSCPLYSTETSHTKVLIDGFITPRAPAPPKQHPCNSRENPNDLAASLCPTPVHVQTKANAV